MARWSQAMVAEPATHHDSPWAPARLQLYVDDPSVVAWGSRARRALTFSLLVLLWLVLGIPLSWGKGALHSGASPYIWIGVLFSTPAPGVTRMALPPKFVKELLTLCRAFLSEGHLPLAKADSLVGKAGRVAYVLPHVRPFISTLYAALAASLRAFTAGAKEAPPSSVACRRFRSGARWLIRILDFQDARAPVPAARDVSAGPPPQPDVKVRRIEFDASPWGGGGVLFEHDVPVRCFACRWRAKDFKDKGVEIGSPAFQTFFELLTATLAIEMWCLSVPTVLVGDNTAALQEILSLKGAKGHEELAQVVAILRCARSLSLGVAHLPSESNTFADALSRQWDPVGSHAWPFTDAQRVMTDTPARPSALWSLL